MKMTLVTIQIQLGICVVGRRAGRCNYCRDKASFGSKSAHRNKSGTVQYLIRFTNKYSEKNSKC